MTGVLSQADNIKDGWLNQPPSNFENAPHLQELPDTEFYEVVASKLSAAIVALSDRACIKLSHDDVRFYCGHQFGHDKREDIYLVRAVYHNGATGRFHIFTNGINIDVSHLSLGSLNQVNRSALVVRLKTEPKLVYVSSVVAK